MVGTLRVGTALTALGLIGSLAACATSTSRIGQRTSVFSDKKAMANAGTATRALIALEKGDAVTAIEWAEKAVANTPDNAAFRTLLANSYFAAGRFASAEQAYSDSLSLDGNQPQVVLKLALVTIAQGRHDRAVAMLDAARNMLDPADYGLALALAGRAPEAAMALDEAARQPGADGRVRQNLALAHALSGDWAMARVVAEQDLAPDQVEARIQQWMSFATPTHASDQVAAMTGVTPAAADPGQPVRLALVKTDTRLAQADSVPEPASVETAASSAPVVVPPMAVEAVAEVAPEPVEVAEAVPPAVAAPVPVEVLAAAAPVAAPVVAPAAAPVADLEPEAVETAAPSLSPRAASFTPVRPNVAKAAMNAPKRKVSGAVVQLGAFSSRENVDRAWNRYSSKYASLRGYEPTTARFDTGNGTLYRLSVAGFGSAGAAKDFCVSLKRAGASCFVRDVAGDRAVQFAAR